MAFRLTKTQIAQLHSYQAALDDQQTAIQVEFARLIDALDALVQPINAQLLTYNGLLERIAEFTCAIHDEHSSAFDECSDRWRESEAGMAASDFLAAWEGVSLTPIDEIDLIRPDEPEFSNDDLRALPEAAD